MLLAGRTRVHLVAVIVQTLCFSGLRTFIIGACVAGHSDSGGDTEASSVCTLFSLSF